MISNPEPCASPQLKFPHPASALLHTTVAATLAATTPYPRTTTMVVVRLPVAVAAGE